MCGDAHDERTATWAPPGAAQGARRGAATTAAVLGFVPGGLTLLVVLALIFLMSLAGGAVAGGLEIVFGLPCAAGMIYGAGRLMANRRVQPLFVAAAASITLLLVLLLAGVVFGGGAGPRAAGTFLL